MLTYRFDKEFNLFVNKLFMLKNLLHFDCIYFLKKLQTNTGREVNYLTFSELDG